MKHRISLTAPLVAVAASAAFFFTPASGAIAAGGEASDYAFNEMVGEMAGTDTGSLWFDYYVEALNQEIAFKESEEPYGAAGPSGPVVGFDGYVAGFVAPDTGSKWFNTYVDAVNRVIKANDR